MWNFLLNLSVEIEIEFKTFFKVNGHFSLSLSEQLFQYLKCCTNTRMILYAFH